MQALVVSHLLQNDCIGRWNAFVARYIAGLFATGWAACNLLVL